MIICRIPLRVSFFGGGTDFPAWYLDNSGAVLATTIDKFSYITCRHLPPFFKHKYRLVYSSIETVQNVSEVQHPAARAVMTELNCEKGLEIHYDGDLPARSGLGTSSAFTVGLIHALTGLEGKHLSKEELARRALYIEQEVIRENVGSQDQVCAAFGGFNHIVFRRDGHFDIRPLILTKSRMAELQSHLMLFFTGFSRIASDIEKSKMESLQNRRGEMFQIGSLVDQAINILNDSRTDISVFGELLHTGWELKKRLSTQVSPPKIDEIYDVARKAGAIGGKLLGAGGGGFMLLFVRPEQRAEVLKALECFIHVPFNFENSGSRVVLYQPDGWH